MNSQIEFDADNKTFGFDEWEYLNFRNRTQLGSDSSNILEKLLTIQKELDDKLRKIPEEINLLRKKIASLNGKLSASNIRCKKLESEHRNIHSEYQSIQEYILHDSPGFLPRNRTEIRIKAKYQDLKDELENLKKAG
jgi:chromosome segregation ATPase